MINNKAPLHKPIEAKPSSYSVIAKGNSPEIIEESTEQYFKIKASPPTRKNSDTINNTSNHKTPLQGEINMFQFNNFNSGSAKNVQKGNSSGTSDMRHVVRKPV